MKQLLIILHEMPVWRVALLLLAQNIFVFAAAVCAGEILTRLFRTRRITPAPIPITRTEIALTVSTIILNTLITIVGFLLWRADIVHFRVDTGAWAMLDVFILVIVMDLAMYVLHRIAHHRRLFPILHQTHHNYNNPRPLTLFVLNPAETLGFGALWLVVIACYSFSWMGMSIYLMLNVIFGTVGHLGVEPLPQSWGRRRPLCWLTTSTFHAEHHNDTEHNFGFYTVMWDRLWHTLRPGYWVEPFNAVNKNIDKKPNEIISNVNR